MTDLLELADRVEAGERVYNSVYEALFDREDNGGHHTNCSDVICTGSLDAAKALHDAVLPGWDVDIEVRDGGYVEVSKDMLLCKMDEFWKGTANVPAAAWVAAILRAKHSMGEDND